MGTQNHGNKEILSILLNLQFEKTCYQSELK